MANWISSKLKVAETLLQQIDQQAAESLRKNEKLRSDDDVALDTPARPIEVKPLKDQLKTKKPPSPPSNIILSNTSNHNAINNTTDNSSGSSVGINNREESGVSDKLNAVKSKSASGSNLTESDWTELLSLPDKQKPSPNGVPLIRGLKKEGKRQGSSSSSLSGLDGKKGPKGQNRGFNTSRKSETKVGNGEKSGGRVSDRMRRSSSAEKSDGEDSRRGIVDGAHGETDKGLELVSYKNDILHLQSKDGGRNESNDVKIGRNDDSGFESGRKALNRNSVGLRSTASVKRSSSTPSNGESDSETDSSTSSSGSESEREREERRRRRQQILAERAAAKASEAIKERENTVARLEGEKQSLEKILEERAKQQAQEATELQTTMIETMEAAELEKQKHNNTRMEILARLAILETANADLARSLANAQWNLELEANRVGELREQIKLKESVQQELRRKLDNNHQDGNNLVASKGTELEREMLEAEHSFLIEKVERLQEKAKTLERNIESTRREIENPTEIEMELKRRLGQLTDHLIQKQAQVEALSSEKATLQFRIETVSRLLDENKSTMDLANMPSTSSNGDLEAGMWEYSNSKLKPMFEERIRLGQQHLGSLIRQLDSIFVAGAVFLRRNSTAKIWSIVYLVILHFWVVYILLSHSPVTDETSGAVLSLENINNSTTGSV